jgi:hypothetical protein
MKWINLLGLITIFYSFNAISFDAYEYDELLEKHLVSGHHTEADVDHQKFEMINSNKYHKEFNKQVRGVASKMDESKNILKFVNPEIEISVK